MSFSERRWKMFCESWSTWRGSTQQFFDAAFPSQWFSWLPQTLRNHVFFLSFHAVQHSCEIIFYKRMIGGKLFRKRKQHFHSGFACIKIDSISEIIGGTKTRCSSCVFKEKSIKLCFFKSLFVALTPKSILRRQKCVSEIDKNYFSLPHFEEGFRLTGCGNFHPQQWKNLKWQLQATNTNVKPIKIVSVVIVQCRKAHV